MNWPERLTCENGSCGRVINTKNDGFATVSIHSNVPTHKGDGGKPKFVSGDFCICASCSKKLRAKLKRKNKTPLLKD